MVASLMQGRAEASFVFLLLCTKKTSHSISSLHLQCTSRWDITNKFYKIFCGHSNIFLKINAGHIILKVYAAFQRFARFNKESA